MSKLTKALAVLTVAVVAACSLTACGRAKMTGYMLDGQRQIEVGDSVTIAVVGDYGDKVVEDSKKEAIAIDELSWKSSNEEVATVEKGVVTAVSAGEVTISATSADEKLTGAMDITVVEAEKTADFTVEVDKTELTLKEKETDKVTATTTPDSDDYTVVWSSSDEKVATVDESGNVTAVATGNAEVTVTVSKGDAEASASTNVNVEAAEETAKPTEKPSKNDKPADKPAKEDSKPSKNDKPADKPVNPVKPTPAPEKPAEPVNPAPAPAPEKPVEPVKPAPAPAPEKPVEPVNPAPAPSLAPDEQPVVSLPIWGDNMNGVPFD